MVKNAIGFILLPVGLILSIEIGGRARPSLVPEGLRAIMREFSLQRELVETRLDPDLNWRIDTYRPGISQPYRSIHSEDETTAAVHTIALPTGIGVRDDGIQPGRPLGVVLGDSLAECSFVDLEACWVEILENRLDVDLVNMGRFDSGPVFHYLLYKNFGAPLDPDLVIMLLSANDFFDDDESLRDPGPPNLGARLRGWLTARSISYNLLKIVKYGGVGNLPTLKATAQEGSYRLRGEARIWMADRLEPMDPFMEPPYMEHTLEYILKLRELAERGGADFLVVYVPPLPAVYRELYGEREDTFHLHDLIQKMSGFIETLKAHGITTVDSTEYFRRHNREQLFFVREMHLTETGNRRMAESVEPFVKELIEDRRGSPTPTR